MSWKDILKDDDEDEYGKRFMKPDGEEFVQGYGFIEEPYGEDRQPITRDEKGKPLEGEERDKRMEEFRQDRKNPKISELVNWFKISLEATMEDMLSSIGAEYTEMDGRGGGFANIRRKPTKVKTKIRELGVEITQDIIDSVIEGFMDAITKDPKFNDEETNLLRITLSSGYQRVYDSGLKISEELMTGIFDSVYNNIRATNEADVPEKEYDKEKLDPLGDVPKEFTEDMWAATSNRIIRDIESILSNIDDYLTDVISQDKASLELFDLDSDGTPDVTATEIKNSIKTKLQQLTSSPQMTNLIKEFTGAVSFAFAFRYPQMQQRMEMNPDIADQTTYEELGQDPNFETEMANRPEIQSGEMTDEERQKFEDKYKSNDTYTGELNWQSILSKGHGVALTSQAGFSPAIHNLAFGNKPCCDECAEVKPPCSRCKDKTTPCGCD
tara:strand:+ start:1579 stop:2898 length:1320 start_codon:yes stop_codon:yes gene_type:complete